MYISYLGRDFVHFETRVNVNERLLNGGMQKLVKTSSIKCLINYFLFFFGTNTRYFIVYCVMNRSALSFSYISQEVLLSFPLFGAYLQNIPRDAFFIPLT